jgi:chorismate mutase
MEMTPEQTLETLRARIDGLDDQLIALLNERIGVVKQVAALKAQHWPNNCHIRPGREGRMHQRIAERFATSDFPAAAALTIWRQIIGASTHVESPLKIAVKNSAQAALAREYFGSTAEIVPCKTLADAMEGIAQGRVTMLLATPRDLGVIHASNPALKVFAALPVATPKKPLAIALANITPEPSGDDISYHLEDNRIVARPGFNPEGVFLGAHPRPIRL